jgi:hypothetical protein
MRRTVILTFLCLTLLSLSCAPVINVSEDYDKQANFGSYRTFDWMAMPEKAPKGAREALESNPFFDRRIKEITDQILGTKGMRESSENPSLLINYYVGLRERTDIADWGYFYGPYWGFFWPGLGPMNVYSYNEGTLVMDFIDARRKEVVWRGVAEQALPDGYATNISEEDLRKILTKMLAQYPPQR